MKKNILLSSLFVSMLILFSSCKETRKECCSTDNDKKDTMQEHILTTEVLTEEEQSKLTPTYVLERLKRGNKEFTEDNLTVRNNTKRVRDAVEGQYPKAVVVSCLDSRVPVEDIFHCGIGDLFVARVAGNIVNEDILGSLEYACKVSNSKLVLVLGHEYCGAVKSAIKDVKLGNITTLLSKIRPAVKAASINFEGDTTANNPKFVDAVCNHNVKLTLKEIRKNSPILKEMEDKGEIIIVGAVYDMESGKVNFFEN